MWMDGDDNWDPGLEETTLPRIFDCGDTLLFLDMLDDTLPLCFTLLRRLCLCLWLPEDEIIKQALALKKEAKAYGAQLILNDNWEIAQELKLDGVHVGLKDTPINLIREKVNSTNFIIGGTANTFEDIKLHVKNSANYIGLGPYKFTSTKTKLSPVLGIEGYQEIIKKCIKGKIQIPIIAIGGIKLEDCKKLLNTGIQGVAIASEINLAQTPSHATELFIKNLT